MQLAKHEQKFFIFRRYSPSYSTCNWLNINRHNSYLDVLHYMQLAKHQRKQHWTHLNVTHHGMKICLSDRHDNWHDFEAFNFVCIQRKTRIIVFFFLVLWVPVGSGEFRWVPVSSGQFRWVPVSSGEFRWVPVSSGEFRWVTISDEYEQAARQYDCWLHEVLLVCVVSVDYDIISCLSARAQHSTLMSLPVCMRIYQYRDNKNLYRASTFIIFL